MYQMSMHSPVQTLKVCSKLRRILLHELHAHCRRQVQRTGQTCPLGGKYRHYRAKYDCDRGTGVRSFVRTYVRLKLSNTWHCRWANSGAFLCFQEEGTTIHRNVRKNAPNSTVSRTRRYWSVGTALWEPQMSQSQIDRLLVTKLFFRYSEVSKQTQTLWQIKWASDCWS
jgi:hypothetical protein